MVRNFKMKQERKYSVRLDARTFMSEADKIKLMPLSLIYCRRTRQVARALPVQAPQCHGSSRWVRECHSARSDSIGSAAAARRAGMALARSATAVSTIWYRSPSSRSISPCSVSPSSNARPPDSEHPPNPPPIHRDALPRDVARPLRRQKRRQRRELLRLPHPPHRNLRLDPRAHGLDGNPLAPARRLRELDHAVGARVAGEHVVHRDPERRHLV